MQVSNSAPRPRAEANSTKGQEVGIETHLELRRAFSFLNCHLVFSTIARLRAKVAFAVNAHFDGVRFHVAVSDHEHGVDFHLFGLDLVRAETVAVNRVPRDECKHEEMD